MIRIKQKIDSLAYLAKLARRDGPRSALKALAGRHLFGPLDFEPLYHARHLPLFETDDAGIRESERLRTESAEQLFDPAQSENSYPLLFEHAGKAMRYAFLPAKKKSLGLVVSFHSWNAWLQLGPVAAWDDYDLLAPWDTFGWNRQGSWYWGERGDPFVARLVQALIDKHRKPDRPLFCIGGSMGGFGALWHGISLGSDGIYAQCPQVDLKSKIAEKGVEERGNPFGHLVANSLDEAPDLLDLALKADKLPPLYLVQTQFDPINPFASHGYRLLDVYNRRHAWYGLRIHPASGHGADGTQREAAYFFSLIRERLLKQGTPHA